MGTDRSLAGLPGDPQKELQREAWEPSGSKPDSLTSWPCNLGWDLSLSWASVFLEQQYLSSVTSLGPSGIAKIFKLKLDF